MSISVRRTENEIAIELGDRFDFSVVDQFRKSYESLGDVGENAVTIDMKHTRYIDSSALGMLINARKYFSEKNIKIILCNPGEQIKKVLSISRFDKKFEIH